LNHIEKIDLIYIELSAITTHIQKTAAL